MDAALQCVDAALHCTSDFDLGLSLFAVAVHVVAANAAATKAAVDAVEAKIVAMRAALNAKQMQADLKRARADAATEIKQAQADAATELNRAKAEAGQVRCRNRAREKLQESNAISKLQAAQVDAATIQAQVQSFSSVAAAAEQRAKAAESCFKNTNSLLAQQLAENSKFLQEWPKRESLFAHQLEAKSKELGGAKQELQDQTQCFKQAMRCTVRAASIKAEALESAAHTASLSASSKIKALEAAAHTANLRRITLWRNTQQKFLFSLKNWRRDTDKWRSDYVSMLPRGFQPLQK
jgi:hypothetical protein